MQGHYSTLTINRSMRKLYHHMVIQDYNLAKRIQKNTRQDLWLVLHVENTMSEIGDQNTTSGEYRTGKLLSQTEQRNFKRLTLSSVLKALIQQKFTVCNISQTFVQERLYNHIIPNCYLNIASFSLCAEFVCYIFSRFCIGIILQGLHLKRAK